MIRFACHHCGLKYQLKDEFGGRQTTCRTCKQTLTVPAPLAATLAVPARIDGLSSHLHHVGYQDGVTVGEVANARAGRRSVREALSKADAAGMRYQVEDEIGRGG